jgi:hypothetical protein
MYQDLLEVTPSDQDGQRELKRTRLRIQETDQGQFDLIAMAKSISKTGNYHVQQASYLSRTCIRQSDVGSRGLFATEAIKAGDMIFCEKAFVASNTPANAHDLSCIINPTNNVASHSSHVAIWIKAGQTAFNNPSTSHRILDLYDGTTTPADETNTERRPLIIDGMPVIDVFRIQNIIEHTSFGFVADKDRAAPGVETTGKGDSSGIWTRAAHMNHSCVFNASRGFIGDFIIMRATKDIAKDEEITTLYCPAPGDFALFQATAAETWGFVCSCMLCKAEKQCRQSRSSVFAQTKLFINTYNPCVVMPMVMHGTMPRALIDQATSLEQRLKKSYPDKLFVLSSAKAKKGPAVLLPTMALSDLHQWLLMAHFTKPRLAIHYALETLRDSGYTMVINDKDGVVLQQRKYCILNMAVVLAMQYIELFHTKLGKLKIAESAGALAEEMYLVENGSMVGYSKLSA